MLNRTEDPHFPLDTARIPSSARGHTVTLPRGLALQEEGEATVHDSRLLHAVSRITAGVRYSLIIFIGQAEGGHSEESAEESAAFDGFLVALPPDGSRGAWRHTSRHGG